MRRGHHGTAALLGILILAAVLTGCRERAQGTLAMDIPFRANGILEFLDGDGKIMRRIAIEIAESDSAKIRGLMDRRSLPDLGGMLFVYDRVEPRSFWMRSTPLPLDILFLDAEDRVINIVQRTTPYSDTHIESQGPARHVLEVRAGATARWGISSGTRIRWQRVEPATGS